MSKRELHFKKAWFKFQKNKTSIIGLLIILLVFLLAIFANFIAPYPEHAGAFVEFSNASQPPSMQNLMGTDYVGRDILSRVFFAFRSALLMGILVLSIAVPIGVVLGLIAGFFRDSLIDIIIMRLTDVFLSIPPLILALAIASVLTPNLRNSMIAITIMWWPWYTRLTYSIASSIRNEYYVQYAEITGGSTFHIIIKEILPNCFSPIFTKMTLDIGWVIMMGASLSFIGLGEQPPAPALGNMVSDGAKYLPDQWWMTIFPALSIVFIILGFNLLGDGVRDALSQEDF